MTKESFSNDKTTPSPLLPEPGFFSRLSKQPMLDLARLAAQICQTPMASICLLDSNQQWFTFQVGLDSTEIYGLHSFSTKGLLQPDLFMIEDVWVDNRFETGLLVGAAPTLRFFAGTPLHTATHQTLGTLCVLDRQPRTLSQEQQDALRTLGNQVLTQLEFEHRVHQEDALRSQLSDVQATLEEQSRLIELDRAIGQILNRTQDFQTLLQGCAEALVHHVDAAFARIWTLTPPDHMLELQASAGLYRNLQGHHHRIAVGQFKIGTIAATKRPILTNSVIGDPHIHDQEWAIREGMVAFAGYPLLRGEEVLGVLALFSRHPLSEYTLHMLATVADRVTVAVECHNRTESLLEFSKRHELILASAGEGIYGLDVEGNTTFINPAGATMLGCEPEELLGVPIQSSLWAMLEGDAPQMRRKDGTWFPVEFTKTSIWKEKNVVGAVVTFRDMTERQRAETALQRHEYLLRSIINNTTSVIYVKWADGRYRLINSQFEKLFHTSLEATQNKTDHDIFPKEIADAFRANDLKVIQTGSPLELEEYAPLEDGLHVYLSVKFPLLDEQRVPYAVCGISTDITTVRRAEEQYRSIIENSVEGIFQTTLTGQFIMANPSFAHLLGYADPEELMSSITDIGRQLYVDPSKREEYQAWLNQYGVLRGFETQMYRKDGSTLWISITARVVREPDGMIRHFEGSIQDITERKRLTAELLEETKLAEVTRVLGDIGHDTKNMLMPVLNGIELLQDELQELLDLLAPNGGERVEASRKVTKEIFEMVTKNSRRIQDRVREIADAVKGVTTPPHFQPCHVATIIDNVIQALQINAVKREVTLHAKGLDQLPAISADGRLLFTAFYNLIDNAIPEVSAGGSVTVQGAVDLPTHSLLLSVADTGKGLPPEQCASLFTTQSVSRKAGGTGLGTKIIKDAVDAHQGSIDVDSLQGVGTTIHIRLPLDGPHQDFLDPAGQYSHPSHNNNKGE